MLKLYTPEVGTARKALRDAIPSTLLAKAKWKHPERKSDFPERADFVVHTGKGAPEPRDEYFAARLGSMLWCLPEAVEVWQPILASRLQEQRDVVVVDSSIRKVTAL